MWPILRQVVIRCLPWCLRLVGFLAAVGPFLAGLSWMDVVDWAKARWVVIIAGFVGVWLLILILWALG